MRRIMEIPGLNFVIFFLVFLLSGMFFNYLFAEVVPVSKNPKYPRLVRLLIPNVMGAAVALLLIKVLRITL